MTRAEHLAWAKERALEYVAKGDLGQAIASMTSDLAKHPELAGHIGIELGAMLLFGGHLSQREAVRHWIEGFN
jgi:hypothetical protein